MVIDSMTTYILYAYMHTNIVQYRDKRLSFQNGTISFPRVTIWADIRDNFQGEKNDDPTTQPPAFFDTANDDFDEHKVEAEE